MGNPIYKKPIHTITTIRQARETTGVSPVAWRLLEIDEGDYELQFTFEDPGMQYWLPVFLRSGKSKVYKSLKAVFADITKIEPQATIYYVGNK